jgi:hypothetical protein
MDVGNRRDRDNPEMQRFTAWSRVLMFRTQSLLYLGLAVVSVAVAFFYRG